MNAICALVEVVPDENYENIVNRILNSCVENKNNIERLKNYVSGASAICRVSSVRFAPFLPKVYMFPKFKNLKLFFK